MAGDPTARRAVVLAVSDSTGQVLERYIMENAWVSALNDTAKVGAHTTEVVTFAADSIIPAL
jgi:hypothetical protein